MRFYSLQKGEPRQELTSLPTPLPVRDLADHLQSLADSAAVIERLDLVIMTDSALAHVAGSLGTPVWNLLQYVPAWLYDAAVHRTPWYPSMRLFRQPSWGDWNGVFGNVDEALRSLARP